MSHDPGYDDRLIEVERREAQQAQRELALRARERELEAEVFGLEGRCRIVQRQLQQLRDAGHGEVDHLLEVLPRLLGPGSADREQSLRARQVALREREASSDARERAAGFLDERLRDALEKLGRCARRAAQLAEQRPAAGPVQLPPSDPQDDRRAEARARLDCQISLNSRNNFFTGFARDLSSGGLFIATFDVQPVGSRVDVGFSLPGGRTIECQALVRWTRELTGSDADPQIWPGMGVEFIDLDEASQRAICTFMELREPMFFVD